MGNWRRRRQGGEIHDQEVYRPRSDNRRPSQEIWKSTVPSWEKKFCSSAGSVSWSKFLETKRYIHLYGSILEWDDSAGKEAFDRAKSRFWAKINCLPCDLSLPGPDIHIDPVDWDAEIDPDLYSDLDKNPVPPEEDDVSVAREERRVFLSEALLLDPKCSCTGWGDAEDDPKPEANNCENEANWGRTGWGDQPGRNHYKGSSNWNQPDRGFRGRRRKPGGSGEKNPLRQWNMKSCAPVS